MDLPELLIRGITRESDIEDGCVLSTLFNEFSGRENPDEDGFVELSVTWYVCDEALDIVRNQKNKIGDIQFKAGIAILSRTIIDAKKKKHPVFDKYLMYEHREVPNNPYHGNLLTYKDISKLHKNMIASYLAMECVTKVISNN